LTGLDGLAGSRNAGSGLPSGTPISAAKDGRGSDAHRLAGDAGAFADILLDLSRPGETSESVMPPNRGSADLHSRVPSVAADIDSPIAVLVDRVASTSLRSHDGGSASPGDERAAALPEMHEAARPGAAVGLDLPVSRLVDRVADPSSRSHDGGLASLDDERAITPPEVREAGPGSPGEAERPHDGVLATREPQKRRGGPAGEASSDSVSTDLVASLRDEPGSLAGLGTAVDLTGSAVTISAASLAGRQTPVESPDRPVDAPVDTNGSRGPSAGPHEPIFGLPTLSEPASGPQGSLRPGSSTAEDSMGNTDISWPTGTLGALRERGPKVAMPDFVETTFDDRDLRLPLRSHLREIVTVLAAETHFPPVAVASVIDQIFHRVGADLDAALGQADPSKNPGSASAVGELRETSATCIRTLTVLLEPANLGQVTIKLRLLGSTLGLEIEADDVEAARLIGRGRQSLAEKLRALGLSVDAVEVSDAGKPRRFP
jgi:hypothetical protein